MLLYLVLLLLYLQLALQKLLDDLTKGFRKELLVCYRSGYLAYIFVKFIPKQLFGSSWLIFYQLFHYP